MNQKDFEEVFNHTVKECEKLLILKGREYAGSDDRLANFKRGAARVGATPMQVLNIYLSKHLDSIETFIRDDAKGVTKELSEPITGRIDDAINYLFLLKAMVVELQRQPTVREPVNSVQSGGQIRNG